MYPRWRKPMTSNNPPQNKSDRRTAITTPEHLESLSHSQSSKPSPRWVDTLVIVILVLVANVQTFIQFWVLINYGFGDGGIGLLALLSPILMSASIYSLIHARGRRRTLTLIEFVLISLIAYTIAACKYYGHEIDFRLAVIVAGWFVWQLLFIAAWCILAKHAPSESTIAKTNQPCA